MALLAKVVLLGKILDILDHPERVRLLGLVALMVIGAGFEVLGIGIVVSFIGIVVNPDIIQRHESLAFLFRMSGAATHGEFLVYSGLILIVVFTIKNGYLAFLTHTQTKFAFRKEVALSNQLLASYLSQPYTFHLQRNTAEMVKNTTVEVSHVVTGVLVPALILLAEGIVFLFVLALVASVEPLIAAATFLLAGGVAIGFAQIVKPLLTRYGQQRSVSAGSRIQWVNQALGSIKETKLLGREAFFVRMFHESMAAYAKAGLVANTIHSLPRLIVEVVVVTCIVALFLVVQSQGRNPESMFSSLALFALAALRIMPSVNRMTPAFNQLRYWFPALVTVHGDLKRMDSHAVFLDDQKGDGRTGKASRVTELRDEIELKNVCYRHPGKSTWSVNNISLTIAKGRSVALIGPSGAGKSTLVDLILGLLEPDKGDVLIDNVPLKQVQQDWQRCIGYVPQMIYLLDDTICQNVALGIAEAQIDRERVREALALAQLENLVRTLPQGMDTMIGENGVRLSGGERQRVGIARALYHQPRVLVFDEATSALDSATEREIIATITKLSGTRTILQIAHRLSTVEKCDVIYFLKDGGVADWGRFPELMARNPEFRRLAGADDAFSGDVTARGGASPAAALGPG